MEVARFQAVSNRASSKRLNYVVPLLPTQPPYDRCKTHQRLGVNGGMDALVLCIRYNPPNYPIAKV